MNKKNLLIMGIVVAAVLLAVLFDTMLVNHRPAITTLEAEPERVLPSGSCQIVCTASDRNGDELSYNWSASGGNISGTGAAVNWTAPDSVGSHNVTVTVTDGRGGEVTDYVTIMVRANKPPTITSLIADADWITPSSNLPVTCNATDLDGDELSYEWSTTGGDISGTGAVVSWNAPQEVGIYDITVVVIDGHGSSATDSLPISAMPEQPPIIEALLVTKDRYGHCYLKTEGSGYMVGKGQKYDIECVVSNTSGAVSYNWSCDGGEISGEGSLITWTAPDMSAYFAVTVIASDIANNRMRKGIILHVVPCSACTFGC
jgi:hypothetical protein